MSGLFYILRYIRIPFAYFKTKINQQISIGALSFVLLGE